MSSERENDPSDSESNPPSDNQWIEGILQDPTKKAFLLQKLGLEDPPSLRQGAKLPDKGQPPADISGGKKGSDSTSPHLPQTLSGTFMGFGPGGMHGVYLFLHEHEAGSERCCTSSISADTVLASTLGLWMGLPNAIPVAVWTRALRC